MNLTILQTNLHSSIACLLRFLRFISQTM